MLDFAVLAAGRWWLLGRCFVGVVGGVYKVCSLIDPTRRSNTTDEKEEPNTSLPTKSPCNRGGFLFLQSLPYYPKLASDNWHIDLQKVTLMTQLARAKER